MRGAAGDRLGQRRARCKVSGGAGAGRATPVVAWLSGRGGDGEGSPGPKPGFTSSVGEVWSEPMVAWRGEEGGDENGYTDAWAFACAHQALHSL